MDWINEQIAIGNYLDAQDKDLLHSQGIRSALSLDGTLTVGSAQSMGLEIVETYRLIDGPGNDRRVFQFAVDALAKLVRIRPPVLVQCHAGRSRSVVVVAAYFSMVQGMDPDAAIALIATKRDILITPGLEEILYRLAG